MTHKIFTLLAMVAATFGLQSCLDFDNPGDELSLNQTVTGPEVHHGDVDYFDYTTLYTEEQVNSAITALKTELGQCRGGLFAMRGGKDGNMPGEHAYQYQYSLGPDSYAQYFVTTHKDFPYSNATLTSTYNICEQFNGGPLGSYTMAKNAFMPLLNHPQVDIIPEIKAVYLLYYCLSAQENADLSGPFTYKEDKANEENPKTYDTVRDIYYGIVQNLDDIVACLKHYDQRPDWYRKVIEGIIATDVANRAYQVGGKSGVEPYIALANSLKLRMAMHIVKVEPETAKRWAEEAVASGVIESPAYQHAVSPYTSGFSHPLITILNDWNDSRISASMESLLMSLDHPYTKYLILPNSRDIDDKGGVIAANSRIIGLRAGTLVGDGQSISTNPYIAYSSLSSDIIGYAPMYLIKYAEVCFLRAEGALRGWQMGGDAETFYQEGIRYAYPEEPEYLAFYPDMGMAVYNDFVEEYMQRTEPVAYTQYDPVTGTSWPSVTKIGVKWNNGESPETKLEKIITQKYLALFPLSTEAWTELRRTGYPALFGVLNPDEGDGTLAPGDIIRRIPWLTTDPRKQQIINDSAIPALGDEDFQSSRLWWDKPVGNF